VSAFDFKAWREDMGWTLKVAQARLAAVAAPGKGPSYQLLKQVAAGTTPCSEKTATLCRAATHAQRATLRRWLDADAPVTQSPTATGAP